MYKLIRSTPISALNRRDIKMINLCIHSAQDSTFDSSKKLGACLVQKESRLLCGS